MLVSYNPLGIAPGPRAPLSRRDTGGGAYQVRPQRDDKGWNRIGDFGEQIDSGPG